MRRPYILEHTSEGIQTYSIQDLMLKHRELDCTGDLTPEAVGELMLQLRYLHREDPSAPITLYINSPGGEVSSGLALYDMMQLASCPIHTVCTGTAASMAAVLFLAGNQRAMLPHAQLMLHDPLLKQSLSGSALEVDRISQGLMKTRETLASIIAKHSGKSLEEVYAVTCKDTYFDAQEALDWGLTDSILQKL